MTVKKYRSTFEERIHKHLLPHCKYEPFRMSYPINTVREYIPDLVDEDRKIMWELKGYFRERQEASKYFPIIEEAKKRGYRFIFIFQNPHSRMPGVRTRKDGTKQTMSEWADRNGLEWFSHRNVPKELRGCQ